MSPDRPDHASLADIDDENLRQLGSMLVGIAHELNTPLSVVVSTCDSLQRCRDKLHEVLDQPALSGEDHERLRTILAHMDDGQPVIATGLDRLQALVRALRLSARGEGAGQHEPVSLVKVLESVLLLLHFELKQGIAVERRFEVEPTVLAHEVFLGQVFLNLLRNAIQAMAGQGTITLSVRERGDRVVVEVADSGPGIPGEVLAQLFTCRLTTKCPETGTGIGLMNCRHVLEKHGGSITAANGPDGGAVFTVTLPRA